MALVVEVGKGVVKEGLAAVGAVVLVAGAVAGTAVVIRTGALAVGMGAATIIATMAFGVLRRRELL